MAAPSAPTKTTLVTEALKQAGFANPSSSKITRAEDNWLEQVKNDIWMKERRLRSLYVSSNAVLTKGQSKYSLPTDFWAELDLVLMDHDHSGTAQAGSASSITLESGEDASEDDVVGKEIFIPSGTGVGSLAQATAYDTSTLVATTTPVWATTPASGSGYRIINSYHHLERVPIWTLDKTVKPAIGRPQEYAVIGDADNWEFLFERPPDKAYAAKLRFYTDLMELDLDGTLMATLYRRWRNVWINGVIFRARKDEDDVPDMISSAEIAYQRSLNEMIKQEKMGAEQESDLGESQLIL